MVYIEGDDTGDINDKLVDILSEEQLLSLKRFRGEGTRKNMLYPSMLGIGELSKNARMARDAHFRLHGRVFTLDLSARAP